MSNRREHTAGGMRACVERAIECLEGSEDDGPGTNGYAALLNLRDALSSDAGRATAACVRAVRTRETAAEKGARGDLGRVRYDWLGAPDHVTQKEWIDAGNADDAAHAEAIEALKILDETSR